MKLLILIAAVVLLAAAYGYPGPMMAKEGATNFELQLDIRPVKSIIRTVKTGKQIWNFSGPNKGQWVDEKGKKIESSNYSIKSPATLVIKKVTKADAGIYDYEERPEDIMTPPPGVHVDPGMRGYKLDVL
ncbi:unnamed protein product [Caenorhabditis bovis]|uniref:Uncharacterized protein n=1 Tax=Caenorhabditis bovis TaxID=2654633 RepID=A0A8S1F5K0_9PELO|nr:unnamed protein product [Caenorhabditis bovis]